MLPTAFWDHVREISMAAYRLTELVLILEFGRWQNQRLGYAGKLCDDCKLAITLSSRINNASRASNTISKPRGVPASTMT